jgi:hypothetical protein
MEIWKPIKNYEGVYEISNLGRVKRLETLVKNRGGYRLVKERILKIPYSPNLRYYSIFLSNGKVKQHYIHRLLAIAFIPNPLNKEQVNHKDGNKLNNSLSNLEWVTKSENQIHAIQNGLINLFGRN